MSQVISVVQEKGGAGKSTLLAALASLMAKDGARVAIIDTDPQKTISKWADKDNSNVNYVYEEEEAHLRPTVKALSKDKYDVIFIDTAGYKSAMATFAIGISNLILIPSKASEPDAMGAKKTFEYVQAVAENMEKSIVSYVIMNDVDKNTRITQSIFEALDNVEGLKRLSATCWHRTGLKEMISLGGEPLGTARSTVQQVIAALQIENALEFYCLKEEV